MPFRSTRPRLATQKSVSGFQARAERLRKGRATAALLREVCPRATQIAVLLKFRTAVARGPIVRALPRGSSLLWLSLSLWRLRWHLRSQSCSAVDSLGPALQASGTLECSGVRSRHRIPRQTCGLQVSYIVNAERLPGPPREPNQLSAHGA